MKRLSLILLIDDDEATNYLNKRLILEAGFTGEVIECTSAVDALGYLTTKQEDFTYPQPDMIFLDINMPGMDGWGFLDQYKYLDPIQKAKVVVVMLTTSLNPADKEEAEKRGYISEFHIKPMTAQMFQELTNKYFGKIGAS